MTKTKVSIGLVLLLAFAMATGLYERSINLVIGAGLLQTIIAFVHVVRISDLEVVLLKYKTTIEDLHKRLDGMQVTLEESLDERQVLATANDNLNMAALRNSRELQRLRMKTPAVNKLQAHNEQLQRKVEQLQHQLAKERSENKLYFRPGRRQPISSNTRG